MSNQQVMDYFHQTRELLNEVSPTFCAAKWLQSTIHLATGRTHSCHHPTSHGIEVSALANPKSLHNTPIKFVARQDLLNGIQTPECEYCWSVENSGNSLSDRTYKSADSWARPFWSQIEKADQEIDPTYLEISFDNTCNLKCVYCSPDISSKWMEEVKRWGPQKLHNQVIHDIKWIKDSGRMPIPAKDHNPYTEAFWSWWPSLSQSLKVFRVTGGEPLLSPNTWKILEYLVDNPRPELELAINTNLCVPQVLLDKFIDLINQVQNNVKSLDVYTSCESSGPASEYIRYGFIEEKFWNSCREILSKTGSRLHFMSTVNVLCVSTLNDFLLKVFALRKEFNLSPEENRVPLVLALLRWPSFLDIGLARSLVHEVGPGWRQTLEKQEGNARFYLEEKDQMNRLLTRVADGVENEGVEHLNLGLFLKQLDERRGTDSNSVFPFLKSLRSANPDF
jgi:organic radical activating enzyme